MVAVEEVLVGVGGGLDDVEALGADEEGGGAVRPADHPRVGLALDGALRVPHLPPAHDVLHHLLRDVLLPRVRLALPRLLIPRVLHHLLHPLVRHERLTLHSDHIRQSHQLQPYPSLVPTTGSHCSVSAAPDAGTAVVPFTAGARTRGVGDDEGDSAC